MMWAHPLLGGVLIGLGTVLLMATCGRIAGISGILGGLLPPAPESDPWRPAFLIGMIAGAPLAGLALGTAPPGVPAASLPVLAAAGLLVGFGSGLGSGCTSGHGICGIARLSPRSLAATATFMATAMATVFVTRHIL